MFKIISNSRYNELLGQIETLKFELQRSIENRQTVLEELHDANIKNLGLVSSLNAMSEENETLKKKFSVSEDNTVTLKISPDMEVITPIISYRADAFESLFQSGMLSDAQAGNEFAIQLALMTVAQDGLSQILSSFEEEISDDA